MKFRIAKAAKILNNLLRINNDRAERYQKATERTHELSLRIFFKRMVVESKNNATALIHELTKSGSDNIGRGTTIRNMFYRFWIIIKEVFTGKDRESVLDACISEEDVAQTAYYNAISSNDLTMQSRQMLRNQQVSLKSLYDIMVAFRNGEPSLMPITLQN